MCYKNLTKISIKIFIFFFQHNPNYQIIHCWIMYIQIFLILLKHQNHRKPLSSSYLSETTKIILEIYEEVRINECIKNPKVIELLSSWFYFIIAAHQKSKSNSWLNWHKRLMIQNFIFLKIISMIEI